MHIHRRALRTAALTAAVVTTTIGLVAVGSAQAAPEGAPADASRRAAAAPAFLAPDELPAHPSSAWYAEEAAAGLPEFPVFCLEDALPAEGASHRRFWTEFDTSAVQVSVRTATLKDARALAAEAEESVRACAAAYEEQYPGAEAELVDYGRVDVQEGAHVYGVDTADPDGTGTSDAHLFGIGRDGRTVTVVDWGQMGNLSHAPVDDFRTTTRTAVEKLRS
ncbi:hypothetical protein E4198_13520 [Streptomyces sp. RKND-216]|uniref:hypothetical protein n=1 Tax=Streptomyces sp. RKND-216 TaxID=2562581 RepID=UPI00109DB35A|nr:hypothetical protein [Streptomyces sp. RKND-216]THA25600.1 hypothetical protein E4198_13520 [Streptomyces sp. RKND-216]